VWQNGLTNDMLKRKEGKVMKIANSVKTQILLERYGLENLNIEEKSELAESLEFSVLISENFDVDGDEDDIAPWHLDLINERIADADANPGEGILWSDLKKKWEDDEQRQSQQR
jgi:hypothetical protein